MNQTERQAAISRVADDDLLEFFDKVADLFLQGAPSNETGKLADELLRKIFGEKK